MKKIGTNNSYLNRYAESGRMFPGVKKIGTKPFFHIAIYLATLLRSKCASTIANSCTSQASEKEGNVARYFKRGVTWKSTENSR